MKGEILLGLLLGVLLNLLVSCALLFFVGVFYLKLFLLLVLECDLSACLERVFYWAAVIAKRCDVLELSWWPRYACR